MDLEEATRKLELNYNFGQATFNETTNPELTLGFKDEFCKRDKSGAGRSEA